MPGPVTGTISERNPPGNSTGAGSPVREGVSLKSLPLATQDIGLKLVGTVVAENPEMSFAVIDNRATGEQWVYREGDWVGNVLIKRILRNTLIIDAGRGDQLLTTESEESRGIPKPSPAPQSAVAEEGPAVREEESAASPVDFRLKRDEVQSSLADLDQLMQQVRITPYEEDNQPAGFMLGGIMGWNVLAEMGLRNGDVIKGVNDEAITSADQAAGFFEKLAEGGDITIQILRRRRSMQIRLKID
jgi:general secretion pathway protein C